MSVAIAWNAYSLAGVATAVEYDDSLHGHRLRKVTRLIDVTASTHTNVISQQLQRDDREYRRNQIARARDLDHAIGYLARLRVTLGHHGNYNSIPGFHLDHV